MVEQRANLDYGRDEETSTETPIEVEGDGFTMTDSDIERPPTERPTENVDYEADDAEHNPEAETLGSP
jgi:hypothetical protein